ncbi:MAG: 30S ribosome-binding factor RbfA [Candidatus Dasytiphilus stammeri]
MVKEKEVERLQRVAQTLKKYITIILQRDINDPRLETIVTVTDVEISSDLRYSKVFITFFDDQDDDLVRIRMNLLQNAGGYIRMLLSKMMLIRTIPKLTFIYDKSIKDGVYVYNLINRVMTSTSLQSIG